jgi:hypothetical protein
LREDARETRTDRKVVANGRRELVNAGVLCGWRREAVAKIKSVEAAGNDVARECG